jgi:hypothetical protein
MFLALPGDENNVPAVGTYTVFIPPGTTLTVEVWIEDTAGAALGSYQVALPGVASLLGATGTFSYVDTPGTGGSVTINTADPAWVFAAQQPSPSFSDGAIPAGFAMLAFLPLGQGNVIPGLGYLGEFQFQASPDAIGTFFLDFQPGGAPPNGGSVLTDSANTEIAATLQRLFVIVQPPPANDSCETTSVVASGTTLFNNVTAASDPPIGSFGAGLCDDEGTTAFTGDVWFEYTAPCDGQVEISTCDSAEFDTRIEVYGGCGVCPPSDLIGCNDTPAGFCTPGGAELFIDATAGQCYTIRVGGKDQAAVGSGTLRIEPAACFIDGQCHGNGMSNPVNACQYCDTETALTWLTWPAGSPCGDTSAADCDAPDTCNTVGECLTNHAADGTACDDAMQCTESEECAAGQCSGTPIACPDGLTCTIDVCIEGSGCTHPLAPDHCLIDAVCFAALDIHPDDTCLFCDPSSSTSAWTEGGPGCACTIVEDCGDVDGNGVTDDACMWFDCAAPSCVALPRTFADAGGPFGICPIDGFANVHDKNHVLTCFEQTSPCASLNADVGGSFGACPADGFCNIHDANHVLAAFAGTTTCSCPSGPAPQWNDVEVGDAVLRLVAESSRVATQTTVWIHIVVESDLGDLRSYQLALGSAVEDIAVFDALQPAFADRADAFCAFNAQRGEMFCGLEGEGVPTPERAYLGSFLVRLPSAAGTAAIDMVTDQTFMIASGDGKIAVRETIPAFVEVQEPDRRRTRINTRGHKP